MMKLKFKRAFYTLGAVGVLLLITAFSRDSESAKSIQEGNHTLYKFPHDESLVRDSIVAYAQEFLGTPYVYGACSKDGFDCSGFVYYVFKHFDINVPRSSSQYKNFGEEVPIDKVKKGDILVFKSPSRDAIGHLGIVVEANGKESIFIHATSGRAMSVVTTPLTNKGYTRRFVKAVSVM